MSLSSTSTKVWNSDNVVHFRVHIRTIPGPEIIFFSCIKTRKLKKKDFLTFELLEVVLIMLINVKMPLIVGILTFNSCSGEHE